MLNELSMTAVKAISTAATRMSLSITILLYIYLKNVNSPFLPRVTAASTLLEYF